MKRTKILSLFLSLTIASSHAMDFMPSRQTVKQNGHLFAATFVIGLVSIPLARKAWSYTPWAPQPRSESHRKQQSSITNKMNNDLQCIVVQQAWELDQLNKKVGRLEKTFKSELEQWDFKNPGNLETPRSYDMRNFPGATPHLKHWKLECGKTPSVHLRNTDTGQTVPSQPLVLDDCGLESIGE